MWPQMQYKPHIIYPTCNNVPVLESDCSAVHLSLWVLQNLGPPVIKFTPSMESHSMPFFKHVQERVVEANKKTHKTAHTTSELNPIISVWNNVSNKGPRPIDFQNQCSSDRRGKCRERMAAGRAMVHHHAHCMLLPVHCMEWGPLQGWCAGCLHLGTQTLVMPLGRSETLFSPPLTHTKLRAGFTVSANVAVI